MQKSILCYGDSNTWGFVPTTDQFDMNALQRYPRHLRWTGRLQQLLGERYYVIEEGLNGRTTNVDDQDNPGLNGESYLPACLASQQPLALVILSLGTNDLKVEFNRQAGDIAQGAAVLIDIIQALDSDADCPSTPEILLVSPPLLASEIYKDAAGNTIFTGAMTKAKQLGHCFADLAKAKNCHFFDMAKHVVVSEIDGLHFDEQGHQQVATLMQQQIKQIFP